MTNNNFVAISVRKQTKDMLPLIKKEYLRNYPKESQYIQTEDFLVKKAFQYYLK